MSVTAIRRFDRAQALEQLRLDPTLAKATLSTLAKRWGVARSTARAWTREGSAARAAATSIAAALTADLPPPPPTALAPVAALAPVPAVVAAPSYEAAPSATPSRGGSAANFIAFATAALLAAVAAYFSVSGMAEIFPGAPIAVITFAGTMEVAKLVTAGWLARNWGSIGFILRVVLISLVTGLAAINAAGVYGRLVEAHVGATVATESSIEERLGALNARIDAQAQSVAAQDQRLAEIDAAIAKLTERGRATAALAAIASERTLRDTIAVARGKEMAVLVELRSDRAKLDAERSRAEAAHGPIVYMAATLGLPLEVTVRWLILLMVLTCDPTAIALTVAAARRG